MTPSRPYLVRAIYEWLVDNNATPYLLVDATQANVRVPTQHVKDGKIVLNIAPHAVKDLFIRNEGISFSARFGGVPMMVSAPMAAVAAIYARENGQGMFFDNAEEYANAEEVENVTVAEPVKPNLSVATENTDSEVSSENPERPKGRPTLSVVK
ncbi:MAG TPA: ClpXP protease specificity-enhancing factor [Agitococcus sp.]|nr:ClpXP protease specificity-enhancing factor [Agitococcus sp.]